MTTMMRKLSMLLNWWRQDLIRLRHHQYPDPVGGRVGKMVAFRKSGSNMDYPTYVIYSCRGGFLLGRLEFRSQWGMYAFYPVGQSEATPLNREILGEIWAMLKELRS